jgi:glycine/D-amino acid oxidase-like deaminating enzyme
VEFTIVDRETGGSSRVAAGLVNPITGKNFEPTPRFAEFLPVALDFYRNIGILLNDIFWHSMPILRLAAHDKEWAKMLTKRTRPDVARWLANDGTPVQTNDWHGALELTGGGRLDTRGFLDASRAFFQNHGIYQTLYQTLEFPHHNPPGRKVWCEGAAGLLTGRHGPHRCAKGEIITLNSPLWSESHILIGAGGWLVPIGGGMFKCGSTYEWEQLDESPTPSGLEKLTRIAQRLGGDGAFDVTAHEAGIRPIIRRSEPRIGQLGDGDWIFNGLGSKGTLFAPGIAGQLADRLSFDFFQPEYP